MRLRAAVFVACAWSMPAQAFVQTAAAPSSFHRCEYAAGDALAPARNIAFPDGDVFRPLLADPKEPRSSFDYHVARPIDPDSQAEHVTGQNIAGISVGGLLGIWSHRVSACHGTQFSLIGGVFSQFNLDAPSRDLINSDFMIGAQWSMRTDHGSLRVRLSHQSSHLGEDFIHQHPPAVDANFGFLAVDAVASAEIGGWRAYGGGGYLRFMNKTGESALLHAGGEYRAHRLLRDLFRPVAGLDVSSLQSRSWDLTTVAIGGFEWASPAETRRMRAIAVFTGGYSPYGQAMLERKARTIGLQFQIEF